MIGVVGRIRVMRWRIEELVGVNQDLGRWMNQGLVGNGRIWGIEDFGWIGWMIEIGGVEDD